jgi:glycosyltransferase involved in cell wall biosynthesis
MCLESIKIANKEGFTFEVIIIDDFSSDQTKSLDPNDYNDLNLKVFRNEHNKMMSASRNAGIDYSTGENILFIDDDNIIDKEMLQHLMFASSKYIDYGIIGPSMYLYHDKKTYMDYQHINLYTGKTTVGFWKKNSDPMSNSDGVPNVFLVRRHLFDKCGKFDESLMQTYTEPDLSFRAKKFGYKCGMYVKAITYHNVFIESPYTPRNMGGAFKQKAYCLMRNRILIVKRFGNFSQKLVFSLLFSWVWPLMYSLLMLPYGRFDLMRYYIYGFIDGLKYMISGKLVNSLPKLGNL